MDKRKVICNYICMLYILLCGNWYRFFELQRRLTFELKWVYFAIGVTFVLSIAVVYLIKQHIFALDVSNFFILLICCILFWNHYINGYIFPYIIIVFCMLFVNMIYALIQKYQKKK